MRISRGWKICLIITTILIIILFVVILTLCLTILKPKQPKVTTKSITLEHLKLIVVPFQLNVTLGLVINIKNPNYGSFKYGNTTSYLTYRGKPAAEASIEEDTIPARDETDISMEVLVDMDSVVANPGFWPDFAAGSLNFTSSTEFHGKAKVLRFLKIKASTYSTCNISVYIKFQNASSVCKTKFKY